MRGSAFASHVSLLFFPTIVFLSTSAVGAGHTERKALRNHRGELFPAISLNKHMQGKRAVGLLGEKLSALAKWYGTPEQTLRRHMERDGDLFVERDGKLCYCCGNHIPALPAAEERDVSARALFPTDQTFTLHSLPSASHRIYLDFDGHTTSGTSWNTSKTGGEDFTTPAYSFSGDSSSFTTSELERIQYIWKRVAEDFSPFDVDVTTEEPSVNDLRKSGSGDSRWGVRVVIGGNSNDWYGKSAGGVAYLYSFDWSSDTPCFVFEDNLGNGNEKYTAEAISHEVGHTLGLYHDGTSTVGYYQGHGSGATGWAPIMGVGYYKSLAQWSKGEYPDANNQEDDLSKIVTHNGFTYRTDDHGDSNGSATSLSGAFPSASGIIERNTDVDVFSVLSGAGTLTINIDPDSRSPNLDIRAELFDVSGTSLGFSNPANQLDASLSFSVSQGKYYIQIQGVGKGDLSTGYSDYGSIGQYVLTGTVPAPPSNAPPDASDDSATTDEDVAVVISVLGNDSDPNGDDMIVQSVSNPPNGTAVINPDNTVTYTPDENYHGSDSFSYTMADVWGETDSATVSVTVDSVNDGPEASNDAKTTDEDTAVTIDVLANDSDDDGDGLSIQAVSNPPHGTTVITVDDKVEYTPDENYNGSDSFTYTVSDGKGGEDTATCNITVNAVNDPPDARDDSATTNEDVAVTIDVLANDIEVDGDTLSVQLASSPSLGSAVVNGDGTITFTPNANANGSDSFAYTLSDGQGSPDTANVSLTIHAVNDGPSASASASPMQGDAPLGVQFTGQGSDVESGPLSFAWDFGDGSQSSEQSPSHTFMSAGTYTVKLTVTDVGGASAGDTVTIVVSAPPAEPLSIVKALIKLKFSASGGDGVSLMGTLPVPQGYDPSGEEVVVDVGGVERTFTLDAKGRAKSGLDLFKLKVKKKKKVVIAQQAKFMVKLRRGDFAAELADEGLGDESVASKSVSVLISITFNGTTYAGGQDAGSNTPLGMLYKAKEGKAGKAASPKRR